MSLENEKKKKIIDPNVIKYKLMVFTKDTY